MAIDLDPFGIRKQKMGSSRCCSPLKTSSSFSQSKRSSSEDKLGAQLDRAAAKVTRAVVIEEWAGYVGEGKGHGADPELIGAVKVVLIHEER